MEKYRNFSLFIILIPIPDFPHFYYILGGNLGSLLNGDVSVMHDIETIPRFIMMTTMEATMLLGLFQLLILAGY